MCNRNVQIDWPTFQGQAKNSSVKIQIGVIRTFNPNPKFRRIVRTQGCGVDSPRVERTFDPYGDVRQGGVRCNLE